MMQLLTSMARGFHRIIEWVSQPSLIMTAHISRIDAAIEIQFKNEICAKVDNKAQNIIVDLYEVIVVESGGLTEIVASMKRLKGKKKLNLAGHIETVKRVFQLARMDTVFQNYAFINEATSHNGNSKNSETSTSGRKHRMHMPDQSR